MLYFILTSFIEDYNFLNIIRYLSFRSGLALITSLLIVFVFAPNIIGWLKSNQKDGQPIRVDGPEWHLEIKRGTPTMGGVIILFGLLISSVPTLSRITLKGQILWSSNDLFSSS